MENQFPLQLPNGKASLCGGVIFDDFFAFVLLGARNFHPRVLNARFSLKN